MFNNKKYLSFSLLFLTSIGFIFTSSIINDVNKKNNLNHSAYNENSSKEPIVSLSYSNLTDNSVEINWDIQNITSDKVLKIEIKNNDSDFVLYEDMEVTTSDLNSFTIINNLNSNTDYNFNFMVFYKDENEIYQLYSEVISLTTLGDPTIFIKYTNINKFDIEIDWIIENIKFEQISEIVIFDNFTQTFRYQDTEITSSDLNSSTLIKGLTPNTNYNFNFIIYYTDLLGNEQSNKQQISFITLEQNAPVVELTYNNITENSINIMWNIENNNFINISEIMIKGKYTNRIYYENNNNNEIDDNDLNSSAMINGLNPGTTYTFSFIINYESLETVTFKNYEETFSFTTNEVSKPILNLSYQNVTQDSIMIKWNIENLVTENLLKIQIQDQQSGEILYSDVDIQDDDLNSSILIENLNSNQFYNFNFLIIYIDGDEIFQTIQETITFLAASF